MRETDLGSLDQGRMVGPRGSIFDDFRHGPRERREKARGVNAVRDLALSAAFPVDFVTDPRTGQVRVNPDVDPVNLTPERATARNYLTGLPPNHLRHYAAEIAARVEDNYLTDTLHVLGHAQPTDLVSSSEGDGFHLNPDLDLTALPPDRERALTILGGVEPEDRSFFSTVLGDPKLHEKVTAEVLDALHSKEISDDPGF